MFKRLAKWEEDKFNNLIERVAEKYPDWFWKDPPERPRVPFRFDTLMLEYWPQVLTFNYWYYLFENLEGKGWDSDNYPNWINFPVWGEWRYMFQRWDSKSGNFKWEFNPKWVWIQLTDETKGRRLICRFRRHPEGEIFWNPGGSEPDHRCRTCGESIG